MDIVDINKVLDDLELNEEQHTKLNGPPHADDENIYNNVYGSMGSSVNQHSQVQSQSSHLNRAAKKKFVNVSNVFNSLNEYVNAGIETVKVTTTEKTNLPSWPSEMYNTSATPTTAMNMQQPSNNDVNTDKSIVINETDEISASKTEAFCETDDTTTTTTTTSSIGNDLSEEKNDEISTLHSSMTQTSEYLTINERAANLASNKLLTENSPTEETSIEQIEQKTEESTAPVQNHQDDRFNSQLTVSEIENAQNGDNERAEQAQLEKIKEMEIGREQQLESIDKTEASNRMPFNTENDNNINNQLEIASKSSDRFIKPISFETAATMDDVSDTELESYLQELEDLEETANCDSNNHNLNNPKLEANVEKVQMQMDERISSANEQNEIEETLNKEDTSDLNRNSSNLMDGASDSINSTETVTTVDNETTTDDNVRDSSTFHQTPPNTLDQMQDVVKTTEPLNDETVVDMENSSSESEKQLDLNCIESNTNQMTNHSTFAPKRPNTLDLPSVITVSNDDTTGTPATTTGQLMISSMSSSNSDMSSQLTPINDIESINPTPESSNDNMANSESPSHDVTNIQISAERSAAAAHLINSTNISVNNIGKVQPYWIPDSMTMFCMLCNQKFSFIKRRHHCRACGLVLCATCCSLKSKLDYLGDVEARICIQCDILLNENRQSNSSAPGNVLGEQSERMANDDAATSAMNSNYNGDTSSSPICSPNPNNPMEYCSVIPPYQQVASSSTSAPISVMVPVGVLKREGVSSKNQRKEKNVMFSDGIRPGCDLTDLDNNWEVRTTTGNGESSVGSEHKLSKSKAKNIKLPIIDPKTNSYIPAAPVGRSKDNINNATLPPICISTRTEFKYTDVINNEQLIERLKSQQLKFIIQRNFYVLVKIIKLTCCINKMVINFTTQGLHLVGQDEIVILLEMDSSDQLPNDIFLHLNDIYRDADKGQAITELGFSMANTTPFLDSKEHGGFLFIRSTFQCMQNVIIPDNPYLIGILIHRWEVPWAKIFPLRLMLRLGALHRYYPSPHVSVRYRNSVYAEIAQTIINFLADFRTYSYTLPTIRGMYIHMEDRRTNVLIPRNRYDQVMKALNNSSDHIIALAGNFSKLADGHLVCVQNTDSGCAETHAYSTQAINIQGKPRKVTGASFFVLNGALKTTSGLSGKCSIVEDGLMVQILPKKMVAIQQALKTMKDIDIVCGPVDGDDSQTELVCIQWIENDTDFNIGVVSPIDKKPMDGIPSIRVHHGFDFANANHTIRWTEVFIIKSDDESAHGKDPIDMSKLSEQIARSASVALVSFLDLLATSGLTKLAIRATLDQDQVCYEAGSNNDKFPPLYMNALDNELIPTLHRQATNLQLDQTICLELIFHILDV